MNFQQLRSIREAVRRNFNLTDVANALYTSQPGVSRQIRELEEELGVKIFERMGKRLIGLTAPGEEIAHIVQRLLIESENLKSAAQEYAGREHGRLAVATTHTQARYALPQVVRQFRREFPSVTLSLQQATPAHIVELLRSGKADIGFASEALAQQPDFAVFEAYRWQHTILVPPTHPLVALPNPSLQDIARYPIITYEEGFAGRHRIDEAFHRQNLQPNIALTAMDSDVIKTYVALEMGVGFVAAMAFDPVKDSHLTRIEVGHLIESSTAVIAVRRGAYLRGYAQSFIHALAPHLKQDEVRRAMVA